MPVVNDQIIKSTAIDELAMIVQERKNNSIKPAHHSN